MVANFFGDLQQFGARSFAPTNVSAPLLRQDAASAAAMQRQQQAQQAALEQLRLRQKMAQEQEQRKMQQAQQLQEQQMQSQRGLARGLLGTPMGPLTQEQDAIAGLASQDPTFMRQLAGRQLPPSLSDQASLMQAQAAMQRAGTEDRRADIEERAEKRTKDFLSQINQDRQNLPSDGQLERVGLNEAENLFQQAAQLEAQGAAMGGTSSKAAKVAAEELRRQAENTRKLSEPTINAVKQEEVRAELDKMRNSYKEGQKLLQEIGKNPKSFGLSGLLSQKAGSAASALADVSSGVPILGSLLEMGDDALRESGGESTFKILAKLRPVENNLAYSLARSRKGQGRLAVQDIENARQDVALTGLQSSDEVKLRIQSVLDEIRNGIVGLGRSAGRTRTPLEGIDVNEVLTEDVQPDESDMRDVSQMSDEELMAIVNQGGQ